MRRATLLIIIFLLSSAAIAAYSKWKPSPPPQTDERSAGEIPEPESNVPSLSAPEPTSIQEPTDPVPEDTEQAAPDQPNRPFGTVTLSADFSIDGAGRTIDSPEIFEADQPENTLLLVTAKGNDLIEVWRFPFRGNEQSPLKRQSLPNGIGIDQNKNQLFIGDSQKETVEVRSLPSLEKSSSIGEGKIGSGETNVDILTLPNGKRQLYATDSKKVEIFDPDTGKHIRSFSPNVDSIEEVLADSYHQIIYVPEEDGVVSKNHPGGAIAAFHPDGRPYLKKNSNLFGKGAYQGDGEGITLYACRSEDGKDTGAGYIVSSDQKGTPNHFEFFDRKSWQHLGTLILSGVSFTDGIDASSRPLPGYPQGLFVAVNNDISVAVISWEKIAQATKLQCD